jgi:hypothetical protein
MLRIVVSDVVYRLCDLDRLWMNSALHFYKLYQRAYYKLLEIELKFKQSFTECLDFEELEMN